MEPSGGNFYKPHMMMVDSGTFWRCEHGNTGLGKRRGCAKCAAKNILGFLRWHAPRWLRRIFWR